MSMKLPDLFFRTRDNGAFVYKVGTDNRQKRIEMEQIAVANIRNDVIRSHGQYDLTEDETSAIRVWMAQRKKDLKAREIDDIFRTIDHLNQTTQWAQTKATPEDLEQFTDELLLTIHDLRAVLIRKKSERMMKKIKDTES